MADPLAHCLAFVAGSDEEVTKEIKQHHDVDFKKVFDMTKQSIVIARDCPDKMTDDQKDLVLKRIASCADSVRLALADLAAL